MPAEQKSGAARALAELSDFSMKIARGQRMLDRVKDEHVQIATADKEIVFREDKTTLYRYKSTAERKVSVPVLVAYGQIGRYTMTDLQEDRSMLRNLLALGVDVYAVDWGSPSRSDRWLKFEDYVDVYLNDCIEFICREHGIEAINLLGICEGGVFSLCYAALNPERVKNLILTITPVDFHQDQAEGRVNHGLLNLWTRGMSDDDVDRLIEASGNLPGELTGYVFSQMTPGATLSKYNVGLLDTFDDEKKLLNFLRMEKWLADRPHHPGEAAKQLLINLYKNNEMIRGEFQLGERTVDLSDISMPVLNVYAKDDHIIPPKTTQALRDAVGTSDYQEIGLEGGHVGVFVSGKSQGVLAKGIVEWLSERDAPSARD
ncbi:PHB de-polymerase domain-containing protein [Caballeronia arvi]|uniref:Poly(3-hydroxyalkanoate) polymerase subunit PhaC n=1 Tax=Caballeronia arvi TaxID=1777135 RepID=A0A158KJQ8_9BURK|nr:class III poly(R)-hydroxyalkanoic acid synthase subunit PhaC [Caballeronia arvi]SAL81347.1 PHB de-polymerase domain-containing protein [Caballeronia arvi]